MTYAQSYFYCDKNLNKLAVTADFEKTSRRKYFWDGNNGDKWEVLERFGGDPVRFVKIKCLTQPKLSIYKVADLENYNMFEMIDSGHTWTVFAFLIVHKMTTFYDEIREELATSSQKGEYIGLKWVISFSDGTKSIERPGKEYDEIMEAYKKECKEADKGDHVSRAITLYKVRLYEGGVEEDEFVASNC